MNVRNLVSLSVALAILPCFASASVKNTLSFKAGSNPKPTTIRLTKYTNSSHMATSGGPKQPGKSSTQASVLFEFQPGKDVPSEFAADATIPELTVETDVDVPGQTKFAQSTIFSNVVITSVKTSGAGHDLRETVEFRYATATTVKKK